MKTLWLIAPSKIEGKFPLVSQNRWFKYLPFPANQIYPIIAAYGVTMIKKAGYDIDFLDAPGEGVSTEQLLKRIPRYDLVIVEARTAIITWIWALCRVLKAANPSLKVALYGDHVVALPEESLENGADYIIQCGDYDYGALRLVEALHGDSEVPRVFHVPLIENLDSLPYLDREAVDWAKYHESWRHRDSFGWIQCARGCWAHCTYCSWVYNFYNHTFRSMSLESAYWRILYGQEMYGIREYLDDSDTFLPTFGDQLADRLIEEKRDIFWNFQTRADLIASHPVEALKKMKQSGLHVVKIGMDCGSDYSLERTRKGVTMLENWTAVEKLKKAGLEVHINMVLGYPWETERESRNIVDKVKEMRPNQAQFSVLQPFPGTPLYDEAAKKGWFVTGPKDYDRFDMQEAILQGNMTSREIGRLHNWAWKAFYLNPRYVMWQIGKAASLALKHRNLECSRHLWTGFKAVYYGHMRAMK